MKEKIKEYLKENGAEIVLLIIYSILLAEVTLRQPRIF